MCPNLENLSKNTANNFERYVIAYIVFKITTILKFIFLPLLQRSRKTFKDVSKASKSNGSTYPLGSSLEMPSHYH